MAPRPRHRAAAERPATGDRRLAGIRQELELTGKLRLDTDQLQVYPDPGTNWGRKTPRLVDVKPINYEAAGSLIKHYLDLAWIGREFGDRLIAEDFQRLVQRKLDIGFATFPGAYKDLHEIKDLLIPLHRPRTWQGPLNKAGEHGASLVRFMGPKLGFDEAISLVREHIIPKLFGMNT